MKRVLTYLLVCLVFPLFATGKSPDGDTLSIRNFKSGLSLENLWKYQLGDNPEWAQKDFDDSQWPGVTSDTAVRMTPKGYSGIAWLRVHVFIDSSIAEMPLAMMMRTDGASDIFVDGRLIHSLGVVGKTKEEMVSGFTMRDQVIPFPVIESGSHTIAVRTSSYDSFESIGIIQIKSGPAVAGIEGELMSMTRALEESQQTNFITVPIFFMAVFLVLSLFHLVLFLYYRGNRTNLYYGLFTFFLFLLFLGIFKIFNGADIITAKRFILMVIFSVFLVPLFFIGILYEVFYKRLLKMFWILASFLGIALLAFFLIDKSNIGNLMLVLYLLGGLVETIRVYIRAWVKKKEGAKIFVLGLFLPILGAIAIILVSWLFEKAGLPGAAEKTMSIRGAFIASSTIMSVSFSMTIYLARDFAWMHKKLMSQISEIKKLFAKTLDQESEKKRILENQKEDLERMVIERTEEVVKQKAEIESKNRDILDNLHYAKRIQEAILPDIKLILQTLKDSFILYWPRDIVSGDFYAFSQRDDQVIIAAADCTGHGVTGAFMSMIGSSLLNQIVTQRGFTKPSDILNKLNAGITEALKQSDRNISDGMDIALCNFNLKTNKLQFAGANRPLWIFNEEGFHGIPPDKLPISGLFGRDAGKYTNQEIDIKPGDSIYLFTDGFADQFGGPNGKKFLSKRFRELLGNIWKLSMKEQEKKITEAFLSWKGKNDQVDDVLVIGIRIT